MILRSHLHPAVSLLLCSPLLLLFSAYENRKRVCLKNQSLRSQAVPHWLTVVFVCVCIHARIIAYREPLNAFPLFLQFFRDQQYLLWALYPKGNIFFCVYMACYLKHVSACGSCTHDGIANSHAKCEISPRLHGHFPQIRHHLSCTGLCRSLPLVKQTLMQCRDVQHFRRGVPASQHQVWWRLEVSYALSVPLPAGAVVSAVAPCHWVSLPLGVGQRPASGHTAASAALSKRAVLLHNVWQPVHIRSDNPRLSNKRK